MKELYDILDLFTLHQVFVMRTNLNYFYNILKIDIQGSIQKIHGGFYQHFGREQKQANYLTRGLNGGLRISEDRKYNFVDWHSYF